MRQPLRLSLYAAAIMAVAGVSFEYSTQSSTNAEALYQQAQRLQQGSAGSTSDRAQAQALLTRAAEQGHAASHYQLAQHYSGQSGARFDPALALHHYQQAADAGHAQAQLELAFLHFNGRGLNIPKDLAAAFVWFEKAAQQGSVAAQCMLGDFYQQGLGGVAQDHAKALHWFRSTAALEAPCAARAQFALYQSYQAGWGVHADLATAIAWLEEAARNGNPQAQRRLSEHYRRGQGVPQSAMLAYNWLRKSREGVAPHDDHDHHTGSQFDFRSAHNQQRQRFGL